MTNYCADVMHDALEGFCAYDLRLIRKEMINQRFFTLDTLNSQMQSLNYSYHDLSNKAPVIVSLDCEMLPFDASEMRCFLQYLPFAIAEFVPFDNSEWAF